jgi:hypothetical protein
VFRARSILFALTAALGVSRHACAGPRTGDRVFSASLEYDVPPACPSVTDFKAIVTGRLGFDPFSNDAKKHVLVSIAAREHALEGRLEWRDEHGNWAGDQTFPVDKNDCTELAHTMGFALAVQINLLTTEQSPAAANDEAREDASTGASPQKKAAATTGTAAPKPAPAARSATTADDADLAAARASNERPGSSRWAFALGAGGSLGIGLLPQATALGRMFASASFGHASLELGGELSTKAGAKRADGARFIGQAWLVTAAVYGSWGPWSVGLLAKGGAVNVEGEGVDVPASPSGKLFLTGVRLGARQRLGSVVFFAERLEGLANLTRWTVTLDRMPVWTAPVLAGTAGFDVGAIFE